MSQDVEIMREIYEHINQRDWAAILATFDEEVVLVVHESVGPNAGIFRGREAVGRWFGDWFLAFGKDYRFEVEEARSVGLVTGEHVPDRLRQAAREVDLCDLGTALLSQASLVALVAIVVEIGSRQALVAASISAQRRYFGPACVSPPRWSFEPDWRTCGHKPV